MLLTKLYDTRIGRAMSERSKSNGREGALRSIELRSTVSLLSILHSPDIKSGRRGMAERQGFEPWIALARHTAFREQRLQPLGHLSIFVTTLFYPQCGEKSSPGRLDLFRALRDVKNRRVCLIGASPQDGRFLGVGFPPL